jgi:AraC family transcriptional regulator of adaptative response/methylated-DNA-[protein]-cysteine methyltransferase
MLGELHKKPQKRWDKDAIKALGIDESTLRRSFQRDFGTTFLKFAREHRLGAIVSDIENGGKIIEAQLDAGYDSASGFVEAVKKQIGTTPANLKNQRILSAKWLETPIGPMLGVADDEGLHLLEFAERKGLPTEIEATKKKTGAIVFRNHELLDATEKQLSEYFAGIRQKFDIPIAQFGTIFEKSVWAQLQTIPYGTTRSYAEQARAIESPNAVRAVARANGSNKIAIIVPCHRVIGSDGSMTGYAGKIWRKEWLLNHERKFKPALEQS